MSPGPCYKTFHVRNLLIRSNIGPGRPFPSNVCGKGQELTLEWSSLKVLHLGLTQKYQTKLEKTTMGKHSSLVRIFESYGRNIFYSIGPRPILVSSIEFFIRLVPILSMLVLLSKLDRLRASKKFFMALKGSSLQKKV